MKILLAQYSLETHSRGMITVVKMLKDLDLEVIYIGNKTPVEIIESAIQEAVDIVGISSYCGGELVLGEDLMKAAKKKGIFTKTTFIIGGVLGDEVKLKKMGFDATFGPGTTQEQLYNFIRGESIN